MALIKFYRGTGIHIQANGETGYPTSNTEYTLPTSIPNGTPWVNTSAGQLWIDAACINPFLYAGSNPLSNFSIDTTNKDVRLNILSTTANNSLHYDGDGLYCRYTASGNLSITAYDITHNTTELTTGNNTTVSGQVLTSNYGYYLSSLTTDNYGHVLKMSASSLPTIPNNYSIVKVGTTTIGPNTTASTLTLSRTNGISLTTGSDSIIIGNTSSLILTNSSTGTNSAISTADYTYLNYLKDSYINNSIKLVGDGTVIVRSNTLNEVDVKHIDVIQSSGTNTSLSNNTITATSGYYINSLTTNAKGHLISATALKLPEGTTSSYTDLSDKPILNTNYSTTLQTNSAETISGTVNLHKVSKTGSNIDLINYVGKKYGLNNDRVQDDVYNNEIFNDYTNNIASSYFSHCEGYKNISYGFGAHTEGVNNYTYSGGSHSEGFFNAAVSAGAHSEGVGNLKYYKIKETYCITNTISISGDETNHISVGDLCFVYDSNDIATITNCTYNSSTNYTICTLNIDIYVRDINGALFFIKNYNGNYMLKNIAYGIGSHVEGNCKYANGNYSHCEGGGGYIRTRLESNNDISLLENNITISNSSYFINDAKVGDLIEYYNGTTYLYGYILYITFTSSSVMNIYLDNSLTDTTVTAPSLYLIQSDSGSENGADYSHVEGFGTISNRYYQHVQGKYNIADSSYIDIIGYGENDSNRFNIETTTKSGTKWLLNDVTCSGTNTSPLHYLSRKANMPIVSGSVSNGTIGQVLTSDGTGGTTWSNNWNMVHETLTVTSNSIAFTNTSLRNYFYATNSATTTVTINLNNSNEHYLLFYNSSSSAITLTLASSSSTRTLIGDSTISVKATSYVEISVITTMFVTGQVGKEYYVITWKQL